MDVSTLTHISFFPGIPEYNCFINSSKTCTNFTVGENGDVVLSEDGQQFVYFHVCFVYLFVCLLLLVEWMAWCGLLIDTKNLEVRSDYSRYANKSELFHISIPS